jgi:hypothetical protein
MQMRCSAHAALAPADHLVRHSYFDGETEAAIKEGLPTGWLEEGAADFAASSQLLEGRTPHDGATTQHVACATTQTKETMEMPKVSRDSAPQRQEAGPVVDLRGELDGYTVSFTTVLEDIDATPLMKGLPDDRCPCPHWGYVLKGRMTARYADRDEVYEAGDAFYSPPGHVPVQHEPGTEFVWFSPSDELRAAEAVMVKNMQAMQDGATR